MPVRVIVHEAGTGHDPAAKGLDAWIEGHDDSFRVDGPEALNALIRDELKIGAPQVLCIPSCAAAGCGLAATGTVIQAAPEDGYLEYLAQAGCTPHRAEFAAAPIAAGLPYADLPAAVHLPQSFYRSTSGMDMEALTRALAAHEVPAEVFPQPSCSRCQARIHTKRPPGMTWVSADGKPNCARRKTKHEPAANPVVAVITRNYRELYEPAGDGAPQEAVA